MCCVGHLKLKFHLHETKHPIHRISCVHVSMLGLKNRVHLEDNSELSTMRHVNGPNDRYFSFSEKESFLYSVRNNNNNLHKCISFIYISVNLICCNKFKIKCIN